MGKIPVSLHLSSNFIKEDHRKNKGTQKLSAMLLVMSLCFAMAVPALAADPGEAQEASRETVSEEQIAAEIDSELKKVYDDVYAQLAAQDALGLLDAYMAFFTPQVEADVRAAYGLTADTRAANNTTYYLSNGGAIGCTEMGRVDVLATYYTAEQYQKYLAANANVGATIFSLNIEDIISFLIRKAGIPASILEQISGWGRVFSTLAKLVSYANTAAQNSIAEAGGYAQIVNMSAAGGTETSSVVSGWKNHPRVIMADYAENIQIERF